MHIVLLQNVLTLHKQIIGLPEISTRKQVAVESEMKVNRKLEETVQEYY